MPSFADANSVLSGFVPTDSEEEPNIKGQQSEKKTNRAIDCHMLLLTAKFITVTLYIAATVAWISGCWTGTSKKTSLVGASILGLIAMDRAVELTKGFANVVRSLAHDQGWYDDRRWLQVPIAFLIAAFATVFVWHSVYKARKRLVNRVTLRTASLVAFSAFYFIRILSNHTIDDWFTTKIMGLRVHWMIEWAFLAAIIYFATKQTTSTAQLTSTT